MRVAILGTGLIGGSLGLALKSWDAGVHVRVYDVSADAASKAVELGAADEAAPSAAQATEGADLVFVATPVGAIVQTLKNCLHTLSDGTILTDVGSTKSRVVLEAEASIADRPGLTFIGGHPMAGSEQEGISGARANLFEGAWWVLTPTERVQTEAYRRLHKTLSAIGAKVMALEPRRHDDLMAVISHIPQLTATTLMNLAAQKGREHGGLLALAAGGFRDVTRVAASNPDLWVEICAENREAIADELEEFAKRLMNLKQHLRDGRFDAIREELTTAREARRTLGKKDVAGDLFEVALEIPDRPGVLAEVTRSVGDLGINIEDLSISHASEGGRGSLHISVLGEDQATKVRDALSIQGYIVKSIQV
jgi:prephenate dehydrogenase